MPRIAWDGPGRRLYEAGVDRGVLYIDGLPGIPWNGLTSVTENPTGGDAKPYYIDGEKFLNVSTREEFEATLTAFTHPDEFAVCDGTVPIRSGLFATQQRRKPFGLSYRTMIGNDQSDRYAYKIHLVYNALASPSSRAHKTLGEATSLEDFSWKLTTLPPVMDGYRRTSHLIVDSRTTDTNVLAGIEDILYGNDSTSARLPPLTELTDLIDTDDTLTVVDNGDGTFTMIAPMHSLQMLDDDVFQLDWPTVIDNGDGTFTASS